MLSCVSSTLFDGLNFITALPTKSDSDIKFCSQSYQRLISDISLVYYSDPEDRINTHFHRFMLAQVECIVVSKMQSNEAILLFL